MPLIIRILLCNRKHTTTQYELKKTVFNYKYSVQNQRKKSIKGRKIRHTFQNVSRTSSVHFVRYCFLLSQLDTKQKVVWHIFEWYLELLNWRTGFLIKLHENTIGDAKCRYCQNVFSKKVEVAIGLEFFISSVLITKLYFSYFD